ncbi:hypothetical protein F2P81_013210 [Scophthalmus maximus]|uniref:Uncharacterized protein n=1 Tax=Scophthalmus maximus TaxID=52904 RepID=A0A6A4SZN0_SCOMX|nr:hypothetical protein F2P81_013210 [Scophthalmus maximus]
MALDVQQIPSAKFTSANESVDFYNNTLSSILDLHAPVKTQTVPFSRSAPWFTSDLRNKKAAGRVLERRVAKTGFTVHRLAYQEHQKAYSKSHTKAWSQFYCNIINTSPGNSKQLLSTINHLLKPQTPSHTDTTEEQCNNFIIFRKKVNTIRSLLSSSPALSIPTANPLPEIFQPVCCFPKISQ